MKFIRVVLVLNLVAICSLLVYNCCIDSSPPKDTTSLSRYSYETGCYNQSLNECSLIHNDLKRSDCYDRASDFCPKSAKMFSEWLGKGGIK